MTHAPHQPDRSADPFQRRRAYWPVMARMAQRLKWAMWVLAWFGWLDRRGRLARQVARDLAALEHGIRGLLILMRRKAGDVAAPIDRRCQRRLVSTQQPADTGTLQVQERGPQPALGSADMEQATQFSQIASASPFRRPREGGDPDRNSDASPVATPHLSGPRARKRRFSCTLAAFAGRLKRAPRLFPPYPGFAGTSPVDGGRDVSDHSPVSVFSSSVYGGVSSRSAQADAKVRGIFSRRRMPGGPSEANDGGRQPRSRKSDLPQRLAALLDVLANPEPHAIRMARALRRAGLAVRALILRPANTPPPQRHAPDLSGPLCAIPFPDTS